MERCDHDHPGKHNFSYKAQGNEFRTHLEGMAERPQDYGSDHGRLITNTVEGFHGLAMVNRGKRSRDYVCKTNVAICHT